MATVLRYDDRFEYLSDGTKRPRRRHQLSEIEVDEISLVDRPAVPGAKFEIAKRLDVPRRQTPVDKSVAGLLSSMTPSQRAALNRTKRQVDELAMRTAAASLLAGMTPSQRAALNVALTRTKQQVDELAMRTAMLNTKLSLAEVRRGFVGLVVRAEEKGLLR